MSELFKATSATDLAQSLLKVANQYSLGIWDSSILQHRYSVEFMKILCHKSYYLLPSIQNTLYGTTEVCILPTHWCDLYGVAVLTLINLVKYDSHDQEAQYLISPKIALQCTHSDTRRAEQQLHFLWRECIDLGKEICCDVKSLDLTWPFKKSLSEVWKIGFCTMWKN